MCFDNNSIDCKRIILEEKLKSFIHITKLTLYFVYHIVINIDKSRVNIWWNINVLYSIWNSE